MLKRRLKFVTALLACIAGSVSATTFQVGNIYYETIDNNQNVCVAAPPTGKHYSGAITIESSVQYEGRDYSIKAIGTGAFAEAANYTGQRLTSIQMSATIDKIEDSAFAGCTGLTSVEIPNRTTYLGASAFEGCTGLTTVTLSSYLTTVKDRAFAGCTKLSRIEVKNKITSIGDQAFLNCSALTAISLPSTLKTIGLSAFQGCTKLSDVVLPDGLTKLGDSAFQDCKALRKVAIPAAIVEIKPAVFSGCTTLSDVTFPTGVTVISATAFAKTALSSLTIPSTVTEIGDNAFSAISALRSLTFADSTTPIKYGSDVFKESPIESLTIGRTLNCTVANSGPFKDQVKLKTLKITAPCVTIAESMFKGCTALVNVTIEKGLSEIKGDAFSGCSSLATLALPESVKAIRKNAFYNCFNLSSFNLPPQVTVVEMQTFYQCRKLPSIDLTKVTEIQNGAFYGCDGLKEVTLGSSLKTMGNDAFSDCLSLASIVIPGNVVTMGDGMFFGCTKLTDVKFEAGSQLLRMGEKTFVDCPVRSLSLGRNIEYTGSADENVLGDNTTLYEVTILGSVDRICDAMFAGCTKLTEVDIPASVSKVGDNAFRSCSSLMAVTSRRETAPVAVASSFDTATYNGATLTVPEGAQASYKAAAGWKLFKSFKELPGVPKYSASASIEGPGSVTLNGSSDYPVVVSQGQSLTIVATPEEGMYVLEARYSMGSVNKTFTESVTIDNVTADVNVSVRFGDKAVVAPTAIEISPSILSIAPGEEAQLFVDFEPYDSYSDITWKSNKPDVATVSADGLVTGVKNGNAVITATTANGLKASCQLTVNDGSVRIEAIPQLAYGQKWMARLLNNDVAVTSGVIWKSSNPEWVTITSGGMITSKLNEWSSEDRGVILTATYEGNEYHYVYHTYVFDDYYFYSDIYCAAVLNAEGEVTLSMDYSGGDHEDIEAIAFPSEIADEFGYLYRVTELNINGPFSVKKAAIPASVTNIERLTLQGCTSLTCLAVKVPSAKGIALDDNAVIYVPAESLDAYKKSSQWNFYYTIRAFDGEPTVAYTVYFTPDEMDISSAPNCYIWDGADNSLYAGEWPGSRMTSTMLDGAQYWTYSIEVDKALVKPMVIFNWYSYQTKDLVMVNGGIYSWSGLIGNTAIDGVNAEGAEVAVNGREVTAPGLISVYTLGGAKVVSGANTVTLPDGGVYIIVTSNGALKAIVK